MANLMDNIPYNADTRAAMGNDVMRQLDEIRRNPQAFEEHLKRTNPQAYQQAMQIRNSANPTAIVRAMAQPRGINPNVLRMLGLM